MPSVIKIILQGCTRISILNTGHFREQCGQYNKDNQTVEQSEFSKDKNRDYAVLCFISLRWLYYYSFDCH